ncbi:MAG: ATP-binding cassette domain-containing protein [Lachnospiraceae bacterium]|nr:ATP-binding cassette domain-containing protein [Lachnospiraceae bacterium]
MSEIIFAASNLTKQYRRAFDIKSGGFYTDRFYALDGLCMEIHKGDIYGFVGKNGAGKTTLMRILAGRARQSAGKVEFFGESEEKGLCVQRRRIGAMIEIPALYLGMTATDNLEVLRLQYGISGRGCILELLKLVGLTDAADKRVKDFSLGMKQRLGLAMALMSNREFLVLDEPINGLDPEGIVEFRELLKKLNRELGITILISSHLLGELSQLATCYGFIHKGKMVEEITAERLREKLKEKRLEEKNASLEKYYMTVIKGEGGER